MSKKTAAGRFWYWLWRLLIIGMAAFVLLTLWFVTGPASRTNHADSTGVPDGAIPYLSAKEVSDLPMSCAYVAQDAPLEPGGRRPHRNHTYLAKHGGKYFVMFSFWYGAEGQPDQEIWFATSEDAVAWSKPELLAKPAPTHGLVARGFVQRDGKLYAQYATHTGDGVFRNNQPVLEKNIALLESVFDDATGTWSQDRTVIDKLINNYPARDFGGSTVMAMRDQDRDTFLAISEDGGMNWDVSGKMPVPPGPDLGEPGLYLPDEPVTFDYANGEALVVLRNNNTFDGRLWAAKYAGDAWGAPYPLNFPSAASKFYPITLKGGQQAVIGNFNPDVQRALVHIAISDDGNDYDRLYRFALEGQYGNFRWRSPQYPHALIDGDTLVLGMSYGKRAISVCKGPASAEAIEEASGFSLAPRLAVGMCNKNYPSFFRRILGYAGCVEHFVWG